jgi:hypothetical protein
MFAGPRARLCFLAFNGFAIAAFMLAGSRLWVDRRVTNVSGGDLGKYWRWEVFSGLLFLFVIAASLAGFVISIRKPNWPSRGRSALLVAVVVGCWLAAIWFDSAHRVID